MLWFVKTRGWDMGVENLKDQGRCVCVCVVLGWVLLGKANKMGREMYELTFLF